jgi:protein required for attachment to host cells
LKLDHYSSEEEEAVEVGAMAAVADGEKKVDGAQEAEDEGIKTDAMVAQDVEASSLLDLSTKTNLTVKNTFFGKKKKGVEY